jgi:hypothetical protein
VGGVAGAVFAAVSVLTVTFSHFGEQIHIYVCSGCGLVHTVYDGDEAERSWAVLLARYLQR